MAQINVNFLSNEMRMSTTVTVSLPEIPVPDEGFPTLYLLHGFSGDNTDWVRHTRVEDYANNNGIAVVMPCGYNSAYTDMRYGQKYFSYLSDELPRYIQSILPLSNKRENRYVAGASMGGYGAMKWGLSRPDFFSAVCSLSGSLRVQDRIEGKSANSGNQCAGMYGDPPKIIQESEDLFYMLTELVKNGVNLPRLSCYCGKRDKPHIYGAFVEFTKHANLLGIPIYRREAPYAGHTWEYWDSVLLEMIRWMIKGEET